MNQDRVCVPLKVVSGAASGQPTCSKAEADGLARLSFKDVIPQRGAKAKFAATAAGRTITVTRKDGDATILSWESTDPVGKVVEVYASQYDDRVAVAFTVRRLGKEVTDIVGFDLQSSGAPVKDPAKDPGKDPAKDPTKDPAKDPTTTPAKAPEDPAVTKAVVEARKQAKGAKSLAAWKAVLALDGDHAEARFNVAAAQLLAKQTADAIATLTDLGASRRDEAIEWLVEARFDPQFAAVRADPKFRAAVGLDRKPAAPYERLMGFGGQWEQTGTSCDKPEVRMKALRDRTFTLKVKTVCSGSVFETPFKGTWALTAGGVELTLPTKGAAVTQKDKAPCVFEKAGDEEALRCQIGRDIEFSVLPARR
ncbi:MAG: hypothetical protein KF773_19665 [Deltaproteobacteria bacterium]|nr:hypothetical protein [Deltaproteobacteria bacterium]